MNYSIQLKNGQILKGLMINPEGKVRANVIFVHGLGEHINRYNDWAGLFRGEGIGFTGLDLPGHGSSDGRRGHIRSYSLTDEMIEILIRHSVNIFPGMPVFIYGHSLGGGIVLDHIIRKKPSIQGAIVTSPWLRLAFEPGKNKLILAAIMNKIFPGFTQHSGLVPEQLSRDSEVVGRYIADPLVHDRISVSLFHNAMKAARFSIENSFSLGLPLLLMHGSDDMICSSKGSLEFASGSERTEIKIWDGGYHELHNEPFRMDVFNHIINWIDRVLD